MHAKRKNNLYRKFLKYRTGGTEEEAELRYKTYKNKLTTIMRESKKRVLYETIKQ